MRCPFCPTVESKVIDSRVSKDGAIIRRRRECEVCGKRFTTYERVEEPLPAVVKKDGRREAFDRMKIVGGVKKACEKRPISMETINSVADDIERWVQEQGDSEVPSSVIGARVMAALHKLDEVAYVRFASVYRSFKDINEFMSELNELLNREK
ncbi:MAG TPA: transcriptional regulator NrdR [bacterium]|nr:transcriptional repressor NrdR [Myxococcales bacterium]HPW46102.1 transcriptional regulator NrdR [bacterium]HQG13975.1 transcriptional regulator NrdR [bacterium]